MKTLRSRLGRGILPVVVVILVALAVTAAWAVTHQTVKTQYFRLGATAINTDGTQTLTAGQSGIVLVCTYASGGTTVTLPEGTASIEGVIYYIVQTAAQDVVLTTATADNNDFIADAVATSDNVTLTGSGHQVGNAAMVIGVQDGASSWAWVVCGMNPEATVTPESAD